MITLRKRNGMEGSYWRDLLPLNAQILHIILRASKSFNWYYLCPAWLRSRIFFCLEKLMMKYCLLMVLLDRFLPKETSEKVRKLFTGFHPVNEVFNQPFSQNYLALTLGDNHSFLCFYIFLKKKKKKKKESMALATSNPDDYVLKPQREGGGWKIFLFLPYSSWICLIQ